MPCRIFRRGIPADQRVFFMMVPRGGRNTKAAPVMAGTSPAMTVETGERAYSPMFTKFPIAGMVRIAVPASQIQSDATDESSFAPENRS
jgi:hypothetical protein